MAIEKGKPHVIVCGKRDAVLYGEDDFDVDKFLEARRKHYAESPQCLK